MSKWYAWRWIFLGTWVGGLILSAVVSNPIASLNWTDVTILGLMGWHILNLHMRIDRLEISLKERGIL